jgi:hypothetical protein
MGLGFVLLIWAAVGLVAASVGAVVLGAATAFATRKVARVRRLTILAAAASPFICLGWGGAVFIFQAAVNQIFLHRDPGLGDTWACPLSNGYAVLMIDETDDGWVYNPATQESGSVTEQEDAVDGVAVVQVSGRYILGRVNGKSLDRPNFVNGMALEPTTKHSDSFFLLDTQTGRRENFTTLDGLQGATKPLAIQLRLQPIAAVYQHYRYTWFDAFAGLVLVAPPLLGFVSLCLWVQHLRRRPVAESPVNYL